YWLRLSNAYGRYAPFLLVGAVALPLLALGGFALAGSRTVDIMKDPAIFAAMKARTHWPRAAQAATLGNLRDLVRLGFALGLAPALGFAFARYRREVAKGRPIQITYLGGPTVDLAPGMTLLEGSRKAGVPHASLCGGRGRCTTCRVRIDR